jgi:hypothetical protein
MTSKEFEGERPIRKHGLKEGHLVKKWIVVVYKLLDIET